MCAPPVYATADCPRLYALRMLTVDTHMLDMFIDIVHPMQWPLASAAVLLCRLGCVYVHTEINQRDRARPSVQSNGRLVTKVPHTPAASDGVLHSEPPAPLHSAGAACSQHYCIPQALHVAHPARGQPLAARPASHGRTAEQPRPLARHTASTAARILWAGHQPRTRARGLGP